jgi:hypothetical protein
VHALQFQRVRSKRRVRAWLQRAAKGGQGRHWPTATAARCGRGIAAIASADTGNTVNWTEYWNQETSLYVNERHRRVHYDLVTREILDYVPARNARLVDYGCGDTLTAHRLASVCDHLFLCDAAPRVRERLSARYGDQPNITVIAPPQFEQLQPHSLGMIVVNSVIQYLSRPQVINLLDLSHAKLGSGGLLLLADIVPSQVGPFRDASELLKFAAGSGFLLPALFGLVRSYFSPYREIRRSSGFLQFEEAEIMQLLREKGFDPRRQPRNIGHNAARMTFLAVRP